MAMLDSLLILSPGRLILLHRGIQHCVPKQICLYFFFFFFF